MNYEPNGHCPLNCGGNGMPSHVQIFCSLQVFTSFFFFFFSLRGGGVGYLW